MRANLNIGFRHGLPLLPLACILIAAGAWRLAGRWPRLRPWIVALLVLNAASSLAYYPHFLTYLSEYVDGRRRGAWIVADSNIDWGQGLVALRNWMDEAEVERVYLSYFGSAWPDAYGIDYVPSLSFQPLPRDPDVPAGSPAPRWLVVSSTLLSGQYTDRDPYAGLRETKPAAVIANHLYVYPAAAGGY